MPGKNYVCVRVRAIKANRAVGQALHDTRRKVPSYIRTPDPRSKVFRFSLQDRIIVEESTNAEKYDDIKKDLREIKNYQDILYQKIKKRKRQRDVNDFIAGIIVFSETEGIPIDHLRKQAQTYLATLAKKYRVLPVYLIEHSDEAKVHFHFLFPNMDQNGNSIGRKIDKTACKELQDLAGEIFSSLGFSRGEITPPDERPRKHYSVLEGHRRELQEVKKEKLTAIAEASEAEIFLNQVLSALDEKKQLLAKHEQLLKNTIDKAKKEKAFLRETLIKQEKELEERKAEYKKYDEEIRRIREERKTILDEKNQLLKEQSDLKAKLKSIRENFTDEIRIADRTDALQLLAVDAFERLKEMQNTAIYDPVLNAIKSDDVDFLSNVCDKVEDTTHIR